MVGMQISWGAVAAIARKIRRADDAEDEGRDEIELWRDLPKQSASEGCKGDDDISEQVVESKQCRFAPLGCEIHNQRFSCRFAKLLEPPQNKYSDKGADGLRMHQGERETGEKGEGDEDKRFFSKSIR